MHSVSFKIWTRVAVSISYDDNNYTTGTSIQLYRCTTWTLNKCIEKNAWRELYKNSASWMVTYLTSPNPFKSEEQNIWDTSCVNFWDEACWFLSLRVFGLLFSALLLFQQRFGRYVIQRSSGVCRNQEPSRNFELLPLLNYCGFNKGRGSKFREGSRHIGRNVVEITIKMKTIVRKPLKIKKWDTVGKVRTNSYVMFSCGPLHTHMQVVGRLSRTYFSSRRMALALNNLTKFDIPWNKET